MALGHKYTVYVNQAFGGVDRIVKIYAEGYSGGVTNVKGSARPVSNELPGSDDDIFTTILGTELKVNLVAEAVDQYIEFATAKNKDYLAIMENASTTVQWQGWIVPAEYQTPHMPAPHVINLTFSCGLGSLADEDYLNGSSYYTGRETENIILAQAMASIVPASPYNLSIRVAISLVPTGASIATNQSALSLSYTDQNKYINDDGTVWNCLDVIRDILKPYRARIVMGAVGWWVIRLRDFALLIESKDIPYVVYTSAGVYSGDNALSQANAVLVYTGANISGRADDVSWAGANQRIRYERAYKQARIRFNHIYNSILKAGSFPESYLDFWTITDGTITRVVDQGEQEGYKIRMDQNLATDRAELAQTINDISAESADQLLTFSAEVRYTGAEDAEHCQFQIEGFLDADAGSGSDRWMGGQVDNRGGGVGVAPYWSSPGVDARWILTVASGEWVSVEMTFPAVPFTGNLTIRLLNATVDIAASDIGEFCEWRNVRLFGSYAGNMINKVELNVVDISDDNLLNPAPVEITSGDIQEFGNEWIFFTGAKSLDVEGLTPITTWRSYYDNGTASKVAYGPQQSLIDYLSDGIVSQHGINRKRLEGTLAADYGNIAFSVFKEYGVFYVPTSWKQDPRSGLIRISAVELTPYDDIIIYDNLITTWVNQIGGDPWETLTLGTDPIITLAEGLAAAFSRADADQIDCDAYETFRLIVTGDFDADDNPELTVGDWTGDISDGMDILIVPRTTAGSSPILFQQDSPDNDVVHENVLIKLYRLYGF